MFQLINLLKGGMVQVPATDKPNSVGHGHSKVGIDGTVYLGIEKGKEREILSNRR